MQIRPIVLTVGWLSLFVACGGDAVVFSNGTGGGGGTGGSSSSSSSGTSTSSSSSGNPDECDGPGQCVLTLKECCPPCNMVTLDDMVAMHEDDVEGYYEEVCSGGPIGCPTCVSFPNPNLFAYCDAGQCMGVDVTSHSFGECTEPADCKLRWGLGCCECGNEGGGLTAIPVTFEPQLEGLVCDPGMGCPECAPGYPDDAMATCDAGHCMVMYLDSSSSS